MLKSLVFSAVPVPVDEELLVWFEFVDIRPLLVVTSPPALAANADTALVFENGIKSVCDNGRRIYQSCQRDYTLLLLIVRDFCIAGQIAPS